MSEIARGQDQHRQAPIHGPQVAAAPRGRTCREAPGREPARRSRGRRARAAPARRLRSHVDAEARLAECLAEPLGQGPLVFDQENAHAVSLQGSASAGAKIIGDQSCVHSSGRLAGLDPWGRVSDVSGSGEVVDAHQRDPSAAHPRRVQVVVLPFLACDRRARTPTKASPSKDNKAMEGSGMAVTVVLPEKSGAKVSL